nr:hypothetical protein Itr_chr04CG12490 [Ipomoea trifida]
MKHGERFSDAKDTAKYTDKGGQRNVAQSFTSQFAKHTAKDTAKSGQTNAAQSFTSLIAKDTAKGTAKDTAKGLPVIVDKTAEVHMRLDKNGPFNGKLSLSLWKLSGQASSVRGGRRPFGTKRQQVQERGLHCAVRSPSPMRNRWTTNNQWRQDTSATEGNERPSTYGGKLEPGSNGSSYGP